MVLDEGKCRLMNEEKILIFFMGIFQLYDYFNALRDFQRFPMWICENSTIIDLVRAENLQAINFIFSRPYGTHKYGILSNFKNIIILKLFSNLRKWEEFNI